MISMKRRLPALLLAVCTLLLAGCGNLFDQEYVSVTDYEPPAQESAAEDEDSITVRNVAELQQALTDLLNSGAEDGRIVFDAAYSGEADRDSIVRLQLTNGLEAKLRDAIAQGDGRLVVLIGRSSLSAEDVENLASRVYRENPIAQPREPRVAVNMLSGTGMQRLYEINFNYSMSAEELQARRDALAALEPFAGETDLPDDPALRALYACRILLQSCSFSETGQNDIYAALILGEANSEGMALAYVELCRRLEIPCQIVYGQRDWRSRCWNIIQLDGANYHVDVAACAENGMEGGFLLPDETMWGRYRWDISSYPPCRGRLSYEALIPVLPEAEVLPGEGESEAPDEEPVP